VYSGVVHQATNQVSYSSVLIDLAKHIVDIIAVGYI